MAAVTASTKSESPRIEWAGVDTGAKIFVGLREPSAGDARAATGTQRRTMTCTANRMRQMAELLFRISFTSSQFTQERANQLVAKPNGLRPSKPLRPASGRVDLPQQPQEHLAFIRTKPEPRIRHLDHLNILPLRIQEKRKRTRRPHRPEEIRLRALRLVGQVEVVHRHQIELPTALRLKHVKRQPVRLHFFHRRQIKLRINPARALHSIRELKHYTRAELPQIKIRQRGCVFAVRADTYVRRNRRLVRQFCLAICLPVSLRASIQTIPRGRKEKVE